jgi:hypothetical protein
LPRYLGSRQHRDLSHSCRRADQGTITDPIDAAQAGSFPDLTHLTVETAALDDLNHKGISFIKADIEGAEEKL